jgi:omega-amidase
MALPITLIQLDIAWEQRQANHARVQSLLSGVSTPAGSMIVLPEMFDVGFTMSASLAQDEPTNATRDFCQRLARQHASHVVAGFVQRDETGWPVNQASVFAPSGEVLGRYVKTFPFSPAGEDKHYAAGRGPVVLDVAGIKVAPIVCYDLRFPELFRSAVDLGAEAFVVIANWPSPRVEHWVTLLKARAIENQAYVIAVNRTGSDPKLAYPGRSMVIDPRGNVVTDAGAGEGAFKSEIDVSLVRSWRSDFPALRDRRKL